MTGVLASITEREGIAVRDALRDLLEAPIGAEVKGHIAAALTSPQRPRTSLTG